MSFVTGSQSMAERWKIDTANFLRGVRFRWKRWTPPRESWDHDHCAACAARFAATDCPDVLHEGFATCEDYVRGAD